MKFSDEMKTKWDEINKKQAAERAAVARDIMAPVINEVCRCTAAWAKKYEYDKPEKTPTLSEKGETVTKLLREIDFGCHTDNVRRLVGALLGEEIPLKSAGKTVDFDRGVVVVPLGRTNGHNYALNAPALVYACGGANAQCVSEGHPTRGSGNHMEYRWSEIRPATPDEIANLIGFLASRCEPGVMSFLGELMEKDE